MPDETGDPTGQDGRPDRGRSARFPRPNHGSASTGVTSVPMPSMLARIRSPGLR